MSARRAPKKPAAPPPREGTPRRLPVLEIGADGKVQDTGDSIAVEAFHPIGREKSVN